MSSFTEDLESENRKIEEATQRYQEAENRKDVLGMKRAFDDISESQKTINRLKADEAKHLADDAHHKALAEQRAQRDAIKRHR